MGMVLVTLLGLVVGVVAKLLMPGKDPGGWIVTALLGIAGSWIGSWLMGALGLSGQLMAFAAAVAGPMILLAVYRLIKGKST
ncbi:GlsB/YeaQ/YmgE family stress response membrane protein [Inhella crocodyli]|uniref:GlsB/YeaQ/YmgE family stress response membrane protein n=2 Tax=Inhella crocodyli TaxID=2499851 RepID=A0A3S2VD33_9BURK|nr:GlsB/YeaQ/YmgE family stress response membrane protein [Inhella crocodyli]